jgi:8-amino-7-oxononanoate synthase
MFDAELKAALEERRLNYRYRDRLVTSSSSKTCIKIENEEFLAFCSNDYLGLADDPRVNEAAVQGTMAMGVGSGASHLVSGHSHYHHQLEQKLAEFTGRERALLLSTGYMANLGVVSALLGRNDTVLEDRLNHASLIDAAILSRAQFKRFQHNDCQQLEQQLASTEGRQLVVVDGVFSMDGDLALLPKMSDLCEQYDAQLMVDDAHGFGVLGNHGGGCAEHFQLSQKQLPILIGTLGKAFGTFGAFVAGSESLIETLIQFARPYIYTTALPPAIAAATLTSLSIVEKEDWRRQQLQQRIQQFRSGAESLGLPLLPSETPIQPVILGDDDIVLESSEKLKLNNILVGTIRPPTVPEGTARLRITFSSRHSEEDVNQLLGALDKAVPVTARH